jgi:hypothetical protein
MCISCIRVSISFSISQNAYVCMHVCMYMYIHTCIRIYIHTYVYIHICTCIHTYIHLYTYVCVATCLIEREAFYAELLDFLRHLAVGREVDYVRLVCSKMV